MAGVFKRKHYGRTLLLVSSLCFISGNTIAGTEASQTQNQITNETGRTVGAVLSILQQRLTAYLEKTGQQTSEAARPSGAEFATVETVETQKEKWQHYALMQDDGAGANTNPVQPTVTDQSMPSSDLGVVRQNDSNVPQQPSMFEQQAGPIPPIPQQVAPTQQQAPATQQAPTPTQTRPAGEPFVPTPAVRPGASSGQGMGSPSSVPAPVQGSAPANSNDFSPLSVPNVQPGAPGNSSEAAQPLREEGIAVSVEHENTLLDFAKLEEEFKNDLKEANHNPSVLEKIATENEPVMGERFAENNIDLYGNAQASDVSVSAVNKEKEARTKVTQQVIIVNIVFFLLVATFGVLWQKRRAKKVTSLANELRS